MRSGLLLAVLLVASPAAWAARKKRPAARAAAKKSAAAPAAAPAATVKSTPGSIVTVRSVPPAAPSAPAAETAAPAGASRSEAVLAALGAALIEDADGLLTAAAFGPAAAMGLRPGDRVWRVDRAETRTRSAAAAARRAVAPEQRPSLIVRRGLETLALDGAPVLEPRVFERGDKDLSAREKDLAAARAAKDDAAAKDGVAEAPPLDWTLRADQSFWVRFPGGLPADPLLDDEIAAETATGLTTDGSLDFLAVPPKTKVWARVISAADDGEVRAVRLVFYKMRPAGARIYPILGVATALTGAPPDLARVSSGGTIMAAAPLIPAGDKRRRPSTMLDESVRVRVRLVDPVSLAEPRAWWRAGPGLWLKTAADPAGKRRFQVTHVVAERAAASAGLKVGDILDSIGGRSSERMDFEEALDALYGPPGSSVKISVAHGKSSQTVELARGVKFDAKGAATPLPLPFEAR